MPSRRARIAILAIRYGIACLIGVEAVLLQRLAPSSQIGPDVPLRNVSLDNVLVFLVVFGLFALAPTAVLLDMTDEEEAALAWRRLARTTVPITIVAVGLGAVIRMF
jgi:hypothetical protein